MNLTATPSTQGSISHALRGLIQNAVRSGATNIRVDLHPDRTLLGHNGTPPTRMEDLLSVVGEPKDWYSAHQDLQALLNPEWCTQIRVSTPTASAILNPKTSETLWTPEASSTSMEGTWWQIHGDNTTLTPQWLNQCAGFTDVDLQIGETLQPAPTKGALVLSSELLDLHLYTIDPDENQPGDHRSLHLGWNLIHIGSESCLPFTEIWHQAWESLSELGRPDLQDLLIRMHVVLTPEGQRQLLTPSRSPIPAHLNEDRLLQELKHTLKQLPLALATQAQPVLLQVTQGITQTELQQLSTQHKLPIDWLEVEMVRAGWRSCPEIQVDIHTGIPQPHQSWHQQYQTSPDIQAVLCNNLTRTLGAPSLPATLALPEDPITLKTTDLPLYLSTEGIKITDAPKVRAWVTDPRKRQPLLALVQGLVVCDEDESFFTESKDLRTAENLLYLALAAAP
ncbi:hypothetical protein [Deinococcus roseus]|uniref:Uncharacterized protein n=1 Tax=Deinococcus roseus TaxID=392414 RepID=A0ABQ2D7F0_9DEIO|nr:hypothetical protein [Deinococcus roseus]GGJ44343.1 hypothetical protein GCM10008938_33220 [Deinococcus roseus]